MRRKKGGGYVLLKRAQKTGEEKRIKESKRGPVPNGKSSIRLRGGKKKAARGGKAL